VYVDGDIIDGRHPVPGHGGPDMPVWGDAFKRAGIGSVNELSGIETHDCFTTSEYMAIDHFGLTPPGKSWQAIEEAERALHRS